VKQLIANLVSAAPGTLDTLDELAQALGDDPKFATTMTNLIGTKETPAGAQAKVDTHAVRTDNPHAVTKAQVGLGNVDNIQQATKAEFNTHNTDSNRHITATERTTWNAKETTTGAQTKADGAKNAANAYTQQATGIALSAYRSGKDANGVFTTVESKNGAVLVKRSVLSNPDANGKYTRQTITYYAANGTTVDRTEVYTISYDVDGNVVSEVKQ
jgi:hypothetical protein